MIFIPVAPEFFFRSSHPPLACPIAIPDPLIQSDSKTTRKGALYLYRGEKAPALQAQSPRTPRGQINVMGHHYRSEPMGYMKAFEQIKNPSSC